MTSFRIKSSAKHHVRQGRTTAIEHIPAKLRGLRQWIVWAEEERDGKPTKVPYRPWPPKRKARTNDPATWGIFDQVVEYALKNDWVAGIGIVLAGGLVGIDLDHCIDDDGNVEPWAQEIIDAIASYTERSPSGRGVHIIARGKLPPGPRRKGQIEMYGEASPRFFTVTGDVIGPWRDVEERQAEIEALHAKIFGKSEAKEAVSVSAANNGGLNAGDAELLRRAREAANGATFERLWRGDWSGYDSQSEADLALCSLLAFWAGPDPQRIDRLFRQSGLYRPKWDQTHSADGKTYGRMTIEKALQRGEFYGASRGSNGRSRPVNPDGADLDTLIAEASTGDVQAVRRLFTYLAALDTFELEVARERVYKELNMKSAQFNRLLRSARNGATGLEGSPYVIEDGRICLRKRTPDGDMLVSLTNFTAEIIEEVTLDDGENQAKELRIAGKLDNGTPLPVARVPIDQFANMKWPTKCWGARAIINAGWGTTDRVREAIQRLSTEIAFRHVFQHLGWTEVEGKHVYLTHAGAVGLGDRVTVELPPSLEAYALPCFPQDPEAALTTSLKFLHLAPLTVTVPILAVVYGAPLVSFISAGYTLWLYGPSGTGKTTILTEALRHYGADFTFDRLPASWSDTENRLEKVAYLAKDALLVVDDYAPQPVGRDAIAYQSRASRLIRAVANRAGRGRLNADTSERRAYAPRGLVASSGEDLPPAEAESLIARTWIVTVRPGDVDFDAITEVQEGLGVRYAHAMAAYLIWVAKHWDVLAEELIEAHRKLRLRVTGTKHRRTAEIYAAQYLALWCLSRCAAEYGVWTESGADEWLKKCDDALREVAAAQGGFISGAKPSDRFLTILQTLIATGRIWLPGRGMSEGLGSASGETIGWHDGEFVYLFPEAAYRTVATFCRETGYRFVVGLDALKRMLAYEGRLIYAEGGGRYTTLRRDPDGKQRRVLQIPMDIIDDGGR